jgi:hypothetical protein
MRPHPRDMEPRLCTGNLIPQDILQKDYYIAGYLFQNFPANKVETVLDDIKVRTIVLDDNSGRGKSSFSTLECIGLSNADVRKIRADLADYAKENHLVSINITATHTHSSIDAQGLWNPPFFKVANNLAVSLLVAVPSNPVRTKAIWRSCARRRSRPSSPLAKTWRPAPCI